MRARYYSPDMKRFMNADIVAGGIFNAITLNRFASAIYHNTDEAVEAIKNGNFIDWGNK